jgi:hypothetical protein
MQSDGRVVEILGAEHSGVIRYHVALLKEPQASEPGRKGRSLVTVGSSSFSTDEDEMQQVRPFLAPVAEAIQSARPRL